VREAIVLKLFSILFLVTMGQNMKNLVENLIRIDQFPIKVTKDFHYGPINFFFGQFFLQNDLVVILNNLFD
jgi:hypothetical protein